MEIGRGMLENLEMGFFGKDGKIYIVMFWISLDKAELFGSDWGRIWTNILVMYGFFYYGILFR